MLVSLDKDGFNANARKTEEGFVVHDKVNDAYFGLLGESFQEKTRKRIDWIVKNIQNGPVIDVGCSQGIVPLLLAKKGIKSFGVDIDSQAILDAEKEKAKLSKAHQKNVEFLTADFLKLNINTKYKTVVFTEFLEHLYKPEEFILKAHKLTEEEGMLIVTVPFGINDYPDHRQNFYVLELFNVLSKYFEVRDVEIIEKWTGFICINKKASKQKITYEELLQKIESKFYDIERSNTTAIYSYQDKISQLKAELSDVKAEFRATKSKMQGTIQNLRIKNERLSLSKSYRIGKKIIDPLRFIYNQRLIGLPFRIVHTMLRPESKPVIAGGSAVYADIASPRKVPSFTTKLSDLSSLKMAAIMDEFTYSSFSPECNILQLDPNKWEAQMKEFKPDVLFLESAWRGKDEKWKFLLNKNRKIVTELVEYCNNKKIPTVFWNKEDPAHTAEFLPLASLCDFVFTTDSRSVPVYRDVLGHSRVYVLPFAAQPKINNPIKEYDRIDKVSFAGSYYSKYTHRCEDFESLIDGLSQVKGIDIYDRNYDRDLGPAYSFPDHMQKFVKGSLPYSEIGKAYKGYEYAINMNTVQTSPTMFARRVFELLASNTIVISNFSVGVKNILGDLVINTSDGKEAVSAIKELSKNKKYLKRFKALGLRTVLDLHNYNERLGYIAEKVFDNFDYVQNKPKVEIISFVDSVQEAEKVINDFTNQQYDKKQLLIVKTSSFKSAELDDIKQVSFKEIKSKKISQVVDKETELVSIFNANDTYAKYFLTDNIQAFSFDDSIQAVGSAQGQEAYDLDSPLSWNAMVIRVSTVKDSTMNNFKEYSEKSEQYSEGTTLATNDLNYFPDKATEPKEITKINKLVDSVATGTDLGRVYEESEQEAQRLKSAYTTKILAKIRIRRTYQPIEMEFKK